MDDKVYQAAQKMVEREVLCCISMLVSDLNILAANVNYGTLKEVSFDEDDLMNLTVNRDFKEPMADYIREMDASDVFEYLTDNLVSFTDNDTIKDLREKMIQNIIDDEEVESFCGENQIEPHESEVYEHWAVSDWLYHKLEEAGETVGRLCGLWVWGRCTTGQSMTIDYVIQKIAGESIE